MYNQITKNKDKETINAAKLGSLLNKLREDNQGLYNALFNKAVFY